MMKERFTLGFFPTPLHELYTLSDMYKNYRLFIKRDDMTGLATGGNKTRKLEYLIQEALNNGCDTIISAGAQQSNHCRQTAAACAIAKLECHLLLGGATPLCYNGNLLLSKLLGAHIHFSGENRKGEAIPKLVKELTEKGKRPYVIPYGGSNLTGAQGFVKAVQELKEQLEIMKLEIDYIFFASSSGGMHAGLTLGKQLYDFPSKLMGINIDKDETNGKALKQVIGDIVQDGHSLFQLNQLFELSEINLVKGYDQAGYGVVTSNEKKTIRLLAQKEGILLDPVYTGRAFFGMLDHLDKDLIPKQSTVLFWHTGGIPAIFNYSDDIVNNISS